MAGEFAAHRSSHWSAIRTPDQRLRVFISSTLEELAVERVAARQAIERMRLTPVMFELGARPHPPRDLYRAYLHQSHIFVGIYGERYGWIAPGEDVSGLEDEYRLARRHPKLLYVKQTGTRREPRLAELLHTIEADATASYRLFATADELGELIENDLALLLTERFEQPAGLAADSLGEPAPTNLPVPRSALVGREEELGTARDLLQHEDVSLVTLTGPGGCGKSRLALEIALGLLGYFEDGVFLVMLEAVRDATKVVPAIADALRIREVPELPQLEALIDQLRDAHTLLVLDNFEHVVEAAPAITTLLERCPRLTALVTSRTPLRVRNERELKIPSLPVPADYGADLQSLSQYAAVTLFIQRARGVRPDFEVTDQNAAAVAEICDRLDGLPLAIELATARLRILSPESLLARMSSRFDVLRGGGRDLPERHRTLRTTIDWSHDLLDEPARRMFRRLSVFAGGSTLEAAETVCQIEQDDDALEVIASLLDSNLLTMTIAAEGDARIGMLDSMRDYAKERLLDSGEADHVRQRHAAFYLALAEQARPHLVGAGSPAWTSRLQAERDNFRLALEWGLEHDVEFGLRLGSSIWRFWEAHNGIVEGHQWLSKLLALPSPPSEARGKALLAAAALACYVAQYESARAYAQEALSIFEALDDERQVATGLNELGVVAMYEGDLASARELLERSLAIKRSLDDDRLTAASVGNVGSVASYAGDYVDAYALHSESLALYERTEDQMGTAIATSNLAHAAMHLGRLDEALERQLESLLTFDAFGDADGSADSLEYLAMLANARGDPCRAARFFGLAAARRDESGTSPALLHRAEVERESTLAQEKLGETYQTEWHAGRAMSVAEAIETARALGTPVDSLQRRRP